MTGVHHLLFKAVDVGLTLWRLAPGGDEAVLVEANEAAERLAGRPLAPGTTLSQLVADRAAVAALAYAMSAAAPLRVPAMRMSRGRFVDLDSRALGEGLAAITLVDSTAEHEVRQRLDQLLHHDPLTGLPNRDAFLDLLDESVASGGRDRIALVVLDIDHFNEVNDTLGHRQGDVLLLQVARRLERVPGRLGRVSRLAGDEFGLLVPAREVSLESVAARVTAAFAQPFEAGEMPVRLTASLGVTAFPDHGSDAAQLLRQADVAMWTAKHSPSGVAVYRPEDDRFNMRRLTLISELRDAILRDALALHYQPKIDLETRRVVGAEALVRWTHHELGEVSPGEFVPLAEQSGLIGPLTAWVLDEAGRQCREWTDAGVGIGVSANISARNLYDPGLARWLSRLFDERGVERGTLTLELTETQLAEDLPMARQLLRRLKALGARVSIDDFGTGYSSLSYLSKLPIDELKIDRSFVGDLDNGQAATVVNSIIGLGHDLGLHVVAEGVESEETVIHLRDLGCDEVQGHHVSRPLPPEQLEGWLMTRALASV